VVDPVDGSRQQLPFICAYQEDQFAGTADGSPERS